MVGALPNEVEVDPPCGKGVVDEVVVVTSNGAVAAEPWLDPQAANATKQTDAVTACRNARSTLPTPKAYLTTIYRADLEASRNSLIRCGRAPSRGTVRTGS